MDFDWTTVILEVLNFLVLVWLLKRFFYRPVLAVIEKRRTDSEKIIIAANALREEATALKAEFESRLEVARKERDLAGSRLDEEIAIERARRLSALDAEVDSERKRRHQLDERERKQREGAMEREAVLLAGRFATRFLERLADPKLETKLVDLALVDLDANGNQALPGLRAALNDPGVRVKVVSAYPLDGAYRAALAGMLGKLAGRALEPEFAEDIVLKAGVCVVAGSWVLMANLRDELQFFTGALNHGD